MGESMNEHYRTAARFLLLRLLAEAGRGRDRGAVDRCLVEATRWLRVHPDDAAILEARDRLRASFPPLR
jgi:hypothetical protein